MNLCKKVLTGQFVVVQIEPLQCCAEAEFRGNVACSARRSFLVRGTLVYRSINLSKNVLTGQSVGVAARRSFLVLEL